MHRWHETNCTEPDIQLGSDGNPICLSCHAHAAPHMASLISSRTMAGSAPSIPPDQPRGQMKLWWPPSVPYSVPSPRSDSTPTSLDNTPAEPRLLPSQFRLIRLAATETQHSPVHLTLETYSLDNCPEYETVSYTWAGEDGDGTPCKPVFIGPYWDILLQTPNCWEMLRFMRPWRGIRTIWVDAICIDQANVGERNTQVANMSRIYSTCMRTVVYLGPDIAASLHERHPRRHRLDELASGAVRPVFPSPEQQATPNKLRYLLCRRYFSRVWVIQELILSPQVVIRIGDVDFWANPAMPLHFKSNVPSWVWENNNAAWVQHMTQGASSVGDLESLLPTTSHSESTDPRDRVFALLGIAPKLSAKPLHLQTTLHADYSLSAQEMFIGLFAFYLINVRQRNVLFQASCLHSNLPNYPTWAPDWTSSTTWKCMFDGPKLNLETALRIIHPFIEEVVYNGSRRYRDQSTKQVLRAARHSSVRDSEKHMMCLITHVDSSTGGLLLRLTQLMPVCSPLESLGWEGGYAIFTMSAGKHTAYLLSKHMLHEVIDGTECIFILRDVQDVVIYLILRPTDQNQKFNLVAVCPFIFIETPQDELRFEVFELSSLNIKSLYWEIGNTDVWLDKTLDDSTIDSLTAKGLFPGAESFRDLSKVLISYLTIHDEATLLDAYAGSTMGNCSPRVHDGYVELTIPYHIKYIWETYFKKTSWLCGRVDYRLERSKKWINSSNPPLWDSVLIKRNKHLQIHIRYQASVVSEWFATAWQGTPVYDALNRLLYICGRTGECINQMLTRRLTEADLFIGIPWPDYAVENWPEIRSQFNMTGDTVEVEIE